MAPPTDNLTNEENIIYELVAKGDLNGLKLHMNHHGIKPNIIDKNGMTPLAHAAYKGSYEICQFLLDQGANPNDKHHEHGYSVLHFAGLGGQGPVCQLLLESGADSGAHNSVGRTASETAAFVGNYRCVTTINNFIHKSEVDYYCSVHGLEKEPKLPPALATPLHKVIIQVNIHPVRISLKMHPSLVKNIKPAKEVLTDMAQKEMKKSADPNHIMAFKLHYLCTILSEIEKCQAAEKEPDAVIETFIRKLMTVRSGRDYMDLLIREAVREFPYRETPLLIQMVTSLAKMNEVKALNIISQVINGQHSVFSEENTCSTCSEENPSKKCSKCRQVQYCDRACQRLHWFIHKKVCNRNTNDNNIEKNNVDQNIEKNNEDFTDKLESIKLD